MDQAKLQELEDGLTSLQDEFNKIKQKLDSVGLNIDELNNFQLKRPLDTPTRTLLEDSVKDIRNYKRTYSITSSATPTPDCETTDVFIVTALAEAATIAAPRGNATDTQVLVLRIQDNGTARALTWNAIYRAGTSPALPTTTTVNKMMYLGFVYNELDTKWDLLDYRDGY